MTIFGDGGIRLSAVVGAFPIIAVDIVDEKLEKSSANRGHPYHEFLQVQSFSQGFGDRGKAWRRLRRRGRRKSENHGNRFPFGSRLSACCPHDNYLCINPTLRTLPIET